MNFSLDNVFENTTLSGYVWKKKSSKLDNGNWMKKSDSQNKIFVSKELRVENICSKMQFMIFKEEEI